MMNEDGIDKDVSASQLEDIVFRESLVFERSSSCPTNTCYVSEFFTDNPNTGESSPEVSFHNYPLLHRLADIPDPQSQRQDCIAAKNLVESSGL